MPDEPEALALVALLLHDPRPAARYTYTGDVVLLQDQDRALTGIAEVVGLLDRALRHEVIGPTSCKRPSPHSAPQTPSTDQADWLGIATLYAPLLAVAPTPVVALNQVVAVAMASIPADGLALIDRIQGLERFHCCTPPARTSCADSAGPPRPPRAGARTNLRKRDGCRQA